MNNQRWWDQMIDVLAHSTDEQRWETVKHRDDYGTAYAELFLFDRARVTRIVKHERRNDDRSGSA